MRLIWAVLICGYAAAAGAQTVPAQTAETATQSPVLTLDQEALFVRSKFGQALRASLASETSLAEAETQKIDTALEAEERDLTAQRGNLPDDDFRALADAFDEKVQKLRAEREAAAAKLRGREATARQKFVAEVTKIIGDYMVERGAVAIIDKQSIIVSLLTIDITAEVVARIDAALGDGSTLP